MKVGVIGAGRIAHTVVPTMQTMEGVSCYAVAARSLERAQEFAAEYGVEKAYGSYEEMVQDSQVDLVYVATPHSFHFDHMMLALAHGKPVLCEKAFTVNAEQAEAIRKEAEKSGLFAAEAIWTRYMPSRRIIQETLDSGIIGEVKFLTANLSYAISTKERLIKKELAGGALLDVGVYGLNFALMHFGHDVERIESSVRMTETGVDGMENITLFFKDGRMAAIQAGLYGRSDRQGIFYGDRGYIVVENINNPQSISVYDMQDSLIRRIDMPAQISGYEYEFRECAECIAAGEKESRSMPMTDTVFVMEVMDTLRKQWGLQYPMEGR